MNAKQRRAARLRRCPATGKIRHVDRATARKIAARLYPGAHMNAYQCDDCGFWHIGHMPYRGRCPGAQCSVDDTPVHASEASAAIARIQAGPGWIVARCGGHWHVVETPAA